MITMSKIFRAFKTKRSDRQLDRWCAEHDIKFTDGRLIVKGLLMSEFGPLLRYYSGGRYDSFRSFDSISGAADGLIKRMEDDFDNPREHTALQVGVVTAQASLNALIYAVRTINLYVSECQVHGRYDRIAAGPSYGRER